MNYPEGYLAKTPLAEIWQNVGIYPHHGIALPLSALHSEESLGIGEFPDLIPLIDWLSFIGMDVLQLLPLNDSGDDPSPYNQISSLALNPIYLRLSELPGMKLEGPHFNALQELRKSSKICYREVYHHKEALLRAYFKEVFSPSASFQSFIEENSWLNEYGLYKALRKTHSRESVWTLSDKDLFALSKKHENEIQFQSFLQYHAFKQMELVKEHSSAKKVLLKGDIPILVSPDSVDHWFYRNLFKEDVVAGAPPDFYNREGQKWNFPIFNWEELKNTDYFWWKQRLKVAEKFYHLYRLDHVVGFFRIWGIPPEKSSREGSFVSSNRYLWPFEGKEHLRKILSLSSLLPLAEDLGTIPPEVAPTLKELGICGTKVIRWEKYWEEDGSFIPFDAYERISLTTVSTHDSETLRQWWEKNPDEALSYADFRNWKPVTKWNPDIQYGLLKDAHETPSLFHINLLQEYLALFPELVHASMDAERINVPGVERKENWTYKPIPSIEKIIADPELKSVLKSLINRNGR